MKSICWLQISAMTKKNIIIKMRDRRTILTEILIPWALVFVSSVTVVLIHRDHYPEIRHPGTSMPLFDYFQWHKNHIIAVAPNTTSVNRFLIAVNNMWMVMHVNPFRQPLDFVLYGTEQEITSAYWNSPDSVPIAVVFNNGDPWQSNLSYTIRTNPVFQSTPATYIHEVSPKKCRRENGKENCPVNWYYYSDFVVIQALFDYTKIKSVAKNRNIEVPDITLALLPKPEYTSEISWVLILCLELINLMIFVWPLGVLVYLIVDEKTNRIKKSMEIMGLKECIYWYSWFIVYSTLVLIISLIAMAILKFLNLLNNSNTFLLLPLLIMYGLNAITFGFMVTPFFSSAQIAAVVSILLYTTPCYFYFAIKWYIPNFSLYIVYLLTLLSPMTFAMALEQVALMEKLKEGLTFDSIWSGTPVCYGYCLVMLTADTVFYAVLAYYLNSHIPSEYEMKDILFYFCSCRCWWPNKTAVLIKIGDVESESSVTGGHHIEPEPPGFVGKEAIHIVNLHKTFRKSYSSEQIVALKGINLTIHEDQIVTVLGHKGSGKTTMFNIMTGMISPTHGTAIIYGHDVRNSRSLTKIRHMLGVCPQYNALFDMMSSREHLQFYARLKGVPDSQVPQEVSQTLTDIALTGKSDIHTVNLTNAQKRKLSLGIALIGNSKIIILDEPTTGTDPYLKRRVWSLLKNKKKGRVILLTTQYMNEAETLADRMAFIFNGRLRYYGSPTFLKNHFGVGYHLTLLLGINARKENIEKLVTTHVGEATKARNQETEVSYILPFTAVGRFPKLFYDIEENINNDPLSITNYTIFMTTLEEVFLLLEERHGRVDATDESFYDIILEMQSRAPSYKSIGKLTSEDKNRLLAESGLNVPSLPLESAALKNLIALDSEPFKPSALRTLRALLRIRLLKMRRHVIFYLVLFLVPPVITFIVSHLRHTKVRGMPPLNLSLAEGPYSLRRAALSNNSGHEIDKLVSAMRDEGVTNVTYYDGNLSMPLDIAPHLVAFEIITYDMPSLALTILYNDTLQHSLPIAMNIISNAYFRIVMNGSTIRSIKIRTHPFEKVPSLWYTNISSMVIAFILGIVITFTGTTLCMNIIHERESRVKSQLGTSGVMIFMYFFMHILVKSVCTFLSFFGIVVVSVTLRKMSFGNLFSLGEFPAASILTVFFVFFSVDIVLFSFCFTYYFKHTYRALMSLPAIFALTGAVLYLATRLLYAATKDTCLLGKIHILLAFLWVPYVPFSMIANIDAVYQVCLRHGTCEKTHLSDYMTNDIIANLVIPMLHIPLLLCLLHIIDLKHSGFRIRDIYKQYQYRKQKKFPRTEDTNELEDDGVRNERSRVLRIIDRNITCPIVVQNLRKEYREPESVFSCCHSSETAIEKTVHVAVHNVSFAVRAGTLFGLLAHDSTGKSALTRIIIGEEPMSSGRIRVDGDSSWTTAVRALKTVGYGQQLDPHWRDITVREHLECYAAIAGVQPHNMKKYVDAYLTALLLEEHAGRQIRQCSVGTRRMLSFALAIVGGPRTVILDEPSKGMDPVSKHHLWDIIRSRLFQGKRGGILNTQFIEEAEALCPRVAVLSKGSLRCLGSIHDLKVKYGRSYKLEMKVYNKDQATRAKVLVIDIFTNSKLEESYTDRLVFSVPQSSVKSLAHCFQQLEKAKSELGTEEYTFSQETFEQVFTKLALKKN